ncbi:MAG: N-acetylmuramoyl-L-alanine amidase [Burkholderiales bacterium]
MNRISCSKCATVAALALGLAACTPLPPRTGLAVEQRPSPNYNERRPNYVILHYTSNETVDPALRTLTSRFSGVSVHYLIGRDGKIYYLVDETQRAWHAGESYWGGNRDLNSASIGIELDNSGDEPYADAQIAQLLALLADLKARHGIPDANFLGHSDVAPRRKVDPGRHFPWRPLAAQGFGLWCDPPHAQAPAGEGDAVLLAAFGYDVSDLPAAVSAFKLHFAPDGDATLLTSTDRAMLVCLVGRRNRGG